MQCTHGAPQCPAPLLLPQVELVPGGQSLAVTNDNVSAYIHRIADYKLNQQIREPTAAFLRWGGWVEPAGGWVGRQGVEGAQCCGDWCGGGSLSPGLGIEEQKLVVGLSGAAPVAACCSGSSGTGWCLPERALSALTGSSQR